MTALKTLPKRNKVITYHNSTVLVEKRSLPEKSTERNKEKILGHPKKSS